MATTIWDIHGNALNVLGDVNTAITKIDNSINQTNQQLNQSLTAIQKNYLKVKNTFELTTNNYNTVNNTLNNTLNQFIVINQEVQKGAEKTEEKVSRFGASADKLGGFIKGMLAKVSFKDVATNIFEMGTALEQTTLEYRALTGGVGNASKAMADMQDFSKMTGLGSGATLKMGEQLLKAGVGADELKLRMTQLNDVSLGNSDTFNVVAGAYTEMARSGSAGLEQLKTMEEAGVPVFEQLQKSTGLSKTSLEELAKDGKLSLRELNGAFTMLTAEGEKFHGVTYRQSQQTGVQAEQRPKTYLHNKWKPGVQYLQGQFVAYEGKITRR